MNFLHAHLHLALRVAAATQLGIAVLNLFLIRIMKWETDLQRMPRLMHEVFQVHCYFISFSLAIFGAITWRFADQLASGASPLAVWLAGGIGLFWLARSAMQWTHYSPQHWRGDLSRTLIHFLLFFGYGALAVTYLVAAFWRVA